MSDEVQQLMKWQPEAQAIRYGRCHCKKRGVMLSYQLPGDSLLGDVTGREKCGYWCSVCDFANAGSRLVNEEQ